jgi:hypothetical protein
VQDFPGRIIAIEEQFIPWPFLVSPKSLGMANISCKKKEDARYSHPLFSQTSVGPIEA